MSKASLAQWLERLEILHPSAMELGLERVSTVARSLDLLPVPRDVITIAGTNGKGSTVAVLEALLGETGRITGAFTSPHFQRFNERIRVGSEEAADTEIIAAFEAIDTARGDVSLTYFEFATLAALLVFRNREVDVLLLEVGLGGRLDAVNIVDPTVAVITSIELDHQDWLGQTRGMIAREKAGILRRGRPAVIADPNPPQELLDCVSAVDCAPALFLGRDFTMDSGGDGWSCVLRDAQGALRPLPQQPAGALLPGNICAALQAAMLLGVEFSEQQLGCALGALHAVGRREMQHVSGKEYLLDVAHNPAAVLKLLEYIDVTPCNGRTIALFSAMNDKDIQGMIDAAAGYFAAWFLADQPANSRAIAAADVAGLLNSSGQTMVSVSKNIRQAFRRAQSLMGRGDRLVVFGSFYTVAEVLPLLDKDRRKDRANAMSVNRP